MSRSPISRKTPLARGAGLSGKRKRLPAMSAKREAEMDDRWRVRTALYDRDHGRCVLEGRPELLGPCEGSWTPQHRRKSSHGGAYDLENLVTCCWRHNCIAIEAEPDKAWKLGLTCREGETLAECDARMRDAGLSKGAGL